MQDQPAPHKLPSDHSKPIKRRSNSHESKDQPAPPKLPSDHSKPRKRRSNPDESQNQPSPPKVQRHNKHPKKSTRIDSHESDVIALHKDYSILKFDNPQKEKKVPRSNCRKSEFDPHNMTSLSSGSNEGSSDNSNDTVTEEMDVISYNSHVNYMNVSHSNHRSHMRFVEEKHQKLKKSKRRRPHKENDITKSDDKVEIDEGSVTYSYVSKRTFSVQSVNSAVLNHIANPEPYTALHKNKKSIAECVSKSDIHTYTSIVKREPAPESSTCSSSGDEFDQEEIKNESTVKEEPPVEEHYYQPQPSLPSFIHNGDVGNRESYKSPAPKPPLSKPPIPPRTAKLSPQTSSTDNYKSELDSYRARLTAISNKFKQEDLVTVPKLKHENSTPHHFHQKHDYGGTELLNGIPEQQFNDGLNMFLNDLMVRIQDRIQDGTISFSDEEKELSNDSYDEIDEMDEEQIANSALVKPLQLFNTINQNRDYNKNVELTKTIGLRTSVLPSLALAMPQPSSSGLGSVNTSYTTTQDSFQSFESSIPRDTVGVQTESRTSPIQEMSGRKFKHTQTDNPDREPHSSQDTNNDSSDLTQTKSEVSVGGTSSDDNNKLPTQDKATGTDDFITEHHDASTYHSILSHGDSSSSSEIKSPHQGMSKSPAKAVTKSTATVKTYHSKPLKPRLIVESPDPTSNESSLSRILKPGGFVFSTDCSSYERLDGMPGVSDDASKPSSLDNLSNISTPQSSLDRNALPSVPDLEAEDPTEQKEIIAKDNPDGSVDNSKASDSPERHVTWSESVLHIDPPASKGSTPRTTVEEDVTSVHLDQDQFFRVENIIDDTGQIMVESNEAPVTSTASAVDEIEPVVGHVTIEMDPYPFMNLRKVDIPHTGGKYSPRVNSQTPLVPDRRRTYSDLDFPKPPTDLSRSGSNDKILNNSINNISSSGQLAPNILPNLARANETGNRTRNMSNSSNVSNTTGDHIVYNNLGDLKPQNVTSSEESLTNISPYVYDSVSNINKTSYGLPDIHEFPIEENKSKRHKIVNDSSTSSLISPTPNLSDPMYKELILNKDVHSTATLKKPFNAANISSTNEMTNSSEHVNTQLLNNEIASNSTKIINPTVSDPKNANFSIPKERIAEIQSNTGPLSDASFNMKDEHPESCSEPLVSDNASNNDCANQNLETGYTILSKPTSVSDRDERIDFSDDVPEFRVSDLSIPDLIGNYPSKEPCSMEENDNFDNDEDISFQNQFRTADYSLNKSVKIEETFDHFDNNSIRNEVQSEDSNYHLNIGDAKHTIIDSFHVDHIKINNKNSDITPCGSKHHYSKTKIYDSEKIELSEVCESKLVIFNDSDHFKSFRFRKETTSRQHDKSGHLKRRLSLGDDYAHLDEPSYSIKRVSSCQSALWWEVEENIDSELNRFVDMTESCTKDESGPLLFKDHADIEDDSINSSVKVSTGKVIPFDCDGKFQEIVDDEKPYDTTSSDQDVAISSKELIGVNNGMEITNYRDNFQDIVSKTKDGTTRDMSKLPDTIKNISNDIADKEVSVDKIANYHNAPCQAKRSKKGKKNKTNTNAPDQNHENSGTVDDARAYKKTKGKKNKNGSKSLQTESKTYCVKYEFEPETPHSIISESPDKTDNAAKLMQSEVVAIDNTVLEIIDGKHIDNSDLFLLRIDSLTNNYICSDSNKLKRRLSLGDEQKGNGDKADARQRSLSSQSAMFWKSPEQLDSTIPKCSFKDLVAEETAQPDNSKVQSLDPEKVLHEEVEFISDSISPEIVGSVDDIISATQNISTLPAASNITFTARKLDRRLSFGDEIEVSPSYSRTRISSCQSAFCWEGEKNSLFKCIECNDARETPTGFVLEEQTALDINTYFESDVIFGKEHSIALIQDFKENITVADYCDEEPKREDHDSEMKNNDSNDKNNSRCKTQLSNINEITDSDLFTTPVSNDSQVTQYISLENDNQDIFQTVEPNAVYNPSNQCQVKNKKKGKKNKANTNASDQNYTAPEPTVKKNLKKGKKAKGNKNRNKNADRILNIELESKDEPIESNLVENDKVLTENIFLDNAFPEKNDIDVESPREVVPSNYVHPIPSSKKAVFIDRKPKRTLSFGDVRSVIEEPADTRKRIPSCQSAIWWKGPEDLHSTYNESIRKDMGIREFVPCDSLSERLIDSKKRLLVEENMNKFVDGPNFSPTEDTSHFCPAARNIIFAARRLERRHSFSEDLKNEIETPLSRKRIPSCQSALWWENEENSAFKYKDIIDAGSKHKNCSLNESKISALGPIVRSIEPISLIENLDNIPPEQNKAKSKKKGKKNKTTSSVSDQRPAKPEQSVKSTKKTKKEKGKKNQNENKRSNICNKAGTETGSCASFPQQKHLTAEFNEIPKNEPTNSLGNFCYQKPSSSLDIGNNESEKELSAPNTGSLQDLNLNAIDLASGLHQLPDRGIIQSESFIPSQERESHGTQGGRHSRSPDYQPRVSPMVNYNVLKDAASSKRRSASSESAFPDHKPRSALYSSLNFLPPSNIIDGCESFSFEVPHPYETAESDKNNVSPFPIKKSKSDQNISHQQSSDKKLITNSSECRPFPSNSIDIDGQVQPGISESGITLAVDQSEKQTIPSKLKNWIFDKLKPSDYKDSLANEFQSIKQKSTNVSKKGLVAYNTTEAADVYAELQRYKAEEMEKVDVFSEQSYPKILVEGRPNSLELEKISSYSAKMSLEDDMNATPKPIKKIPSEQSYNITLAEGIASSPQKRPNSLKLEKTFSYSANISLEDDIDVTPKPIKKTPSANDVSCNNLSYLNWLHTLSDISNRHPGSTQILNVPKKLWSHRKTHSDGHNIDVTFFENLSPIFPDSQMESKSQTQLSFGLGQQITQRPRVRSAIEGSENDKSYLCGAKTPSADDVNISWKSLLKSWIIDTPGSNNAIRSHNDIYKKPASQTKRRNSEIIATEVTFPVELIKPAIDLSSEPSSRDENFGSRHNSNSINSDDQSIHPSFYESDDLEYYLNSQIDQLKKPNFSKIPASRVRANKCSEPKSYYSDSLDDNQNDYNVTPIVHNDTEDESVILSDVNSNNKLYEETSPTTIEQNNVVSIDVLSPYSKHDKSCDLDDTSSIKSFNYKNTLVPGVTVDCYLDAALAKLKSRSVTSSSSSDGGFTDANDKYVGLIKQPKSRVRTDFSLSVDAVQGGKHSKLPQPLFKKSLLGINEDEAFKSKPSPGFNPSFDESDQNDLPKPSIKSSPRINDTFSFIPFQINVASEQQNSKFVSNSEVLTDGEKKSEFTIKSPSTLQVADFSCKSLSDSGLITPDNYPSNVGESPETRRQETFDRRRSRSESFPGENFKAYHRSRHNDEIEVLNASELDMFLTPKKNVSVFTMADGREIRYDMETKKETVISNPNNVVQETPDMYPTSLRPVFDHLDKMKLEFDDLALYLADTNKAASTSNVRRANSLPGESSDMNLGVKTPQTDQWVKEIDMKELTDIINDWCKKKDDFNNSVEDILDAMVSSKEKHIGSFGSTNSVESFKSIIAETTQIAEKSKHNGRTQSLLRPFVESNKSKSTSALNVLDSVLSSSQICSHSVHDVTRGLELDDFSSNEALSQEPVSCVSKIKIDDLPTPVKSCKKKTKPKRSSNRFEGNTFRFRNNSDSDAYYRIKEQDKIGFFANLKNKKYHKSNDELELDPNGFISHVVKTKKYHRSSDWIGPKRKKERGFSDALIKDPSIRGPKTVPEHIFYHHGRPQHRQIMLDSDPYPHFFDRHNYYEDRSLPKQKLNETRMENKFVTLPKGHAKDLNISSHLELDFPENELVPSHTKSLRTRFNSDSHYNTRPIEPVKNITLSHNMLHDIASLPDIPGPKTITRHRIKSTASKLSITSPLSDKSGYEDIDYLPNVPNHPLPPKSKLDRPKFLHLEFTEDELEEVYRSIKATDEFKSIKDSKNSPFLQITSTPMNSTSTKINIIEDDPVLSFKEESDKSAPDTPKGFVGDSIKNADKSVSQPNVQKDKTLSLSNMKGSSSENVYVLRSTMKTSYGKSSSDDCLYARKIPTEQNNSTDSDDFVARNKINADYGNKCMTETSPSESIDETTENISMLQDTEARFMKFSIPIETVSLEYGDGNSIRSSQSLREDDQYGSHFSFGPVDNMSVEPDSPVSFCATANIESTDSKSYYNLSYVNDISLNDSQNDNQTWHLKRHDSYQSIDCSSHSDEVFVNRKDINIDYGAETPESGLKLSNSYIEKNGSIQSLDCSQSDKTYVQRKDIGDDFGAITPELSLSTTRRQTVKSEFDMNFISISKNSGESDEYFLPCSVYDDSPDDPALNAVDINEDYYEEAYRFIQSDTYENLSRSFDVQFGKEPLCSSDTKFYSDIWSQCNSVDDNFSLKNKSRSETHVATGVTPVELGVTYPSRSADCDDSNYDFSISSSGLYSDDDVVGESSKVDMNIDALCNFDGSSVEYEVPSGYQIIEFGANNVSICPNDQYLDRRIDALKEDHLTKQNITVEPNVGHSSITDPETFFDPINMSNQPIEQLPLILIVEDVDEISSCKSLLTYEYNSSEFDESCENIHFQHRTTPELTQLPISSDTIIMLTTEQGQVPFSASESQTDVDTYYTSADGHVLSSQENEHSDYLSTQEMNSLVVNKLFQENLIDEISIELDGDNSGCSDTNQSFLESDENPEVVGVRNYVGEERNLLIDEEVNSVRSYESMLSISTASFGSLVDLSEITVEQVLINSDSSVMEIKVMNITDTISNISKSVESAELDEPQINNFDNVDDNIACYGMYPEIKPEEMVETVETTEDVIMTLSFQDTDVTCYIEEDLNSSISVGSVLSISTASYESTLDHYGIRGMCHDLLKVTSIYI